MGKDNHACQDVTKQLVGMLPSQILDCKYSIWVLGDIMHDCRSRSQCQNHT